MNPSKWTGNGFRSLLDMAATVAVIIAAVMAIRSVSRDPTIPTAPLATVATAQDAQLPKAPVSLSGAPILGAQDAAVALVEFVDFQCEFCAQHVRDTWPTLRREYVDTGRVKVAFRHLPLESHPFAWDMAVVAQCAASQGRFMDMRASLFESRRDLTKNIGLQKAEQLRLDMSRFDMCVRTAGPASVSEDVAAAKMVGLAATPSFLVGHVRPDGQVDVSDVIVGAHSIERFRSSLDTAISTARQFRWPQLLTHLQSTIGGVTSTR